MGAQKEPYDMKGSSGLIPPYLLRKQNGDLMKSAQLHSFASRTAPRSRQGLHTTPCQRPPVPSVWFVVSPAKSPRVQRPAEVAKPQPKRKFIKVLFASARGPTGAAPNTRGRSTARAARWSRRQIRTEMERVLLYSLCVCVFLFRRRRCSFSGRAEMMVQGPE